MNNVEIEPMMVLYVIGAMTALSLGMIEFIYEKFCDKYNNDRKDSLQIAYIVPLTLLSWVSVIALLTYRGKEILWTIRHIDEI